MPMEIRIALYMFAAVAFGIGWFRNRNHKDGFDRLVVLLMVLSMMTSKVLEFMGIDNSEMIDFLFVFAILIPMTVYHKNKLVRNWIHKLL